MADGGEEPGTGVKVDDVDAAEKRYDEASPEQREAAWLELWHARDFTWPGRSEKAMLQTEMVEVPASFPDGREAEGEFKTVTLKDYWRWSVGLPGEERLLTDEEMSEAGLLVEVEGETYHLIHAPDMGWKVDEHGTPLQILVDIVGARGSRIPEDIGIAANGEPNFARALHLRGGWLPGALLRHVVSETAVRMSGAWISDIDLSGLKVGRLNCLRSLLTGKAAFEKATFSGGAFFYQATFSGEAGFTDATFNGEAGFRSTTFNGEAGFVGATFSSEAGFTDATFNGEAGFRSTTFSGKANFSFATFSGKANFTRASFSEGVEFARTTFGGQAAFYGAAFSLMAGFVRATFSGKAIFSNATFRGHASFLEATFGGEADFQSAAFDDFEARLLDTAAEIKGVFFAGADFRSATFSGGANFQRATFSGFAGFPDAIFSDAANFEIATFSGEAHFQSATFSDKTDFNFATFNGYAGFEKATFSGKANFESVKFESVVYFLDVTWSKTNSPNAVLGARFKDRVDFKSDSAPSISAFNEAHFEIPPSFRDLTQKQLNQVFRASIKQMKEPIRLAKKEMAEAKRKKGKYNGLTPDQLLAALEGGFRTLKKVAEDKGNFLLSQTYYRFEVRTRVRRPEIAFWEKVAATLYGLSSDYGNSIARPFVSLAFILAGFAALYLALAIQVDLIDWQDRAALQNGFLESLDFSLKNVFRPLSALSTDAPRDGDATSWAGKLLNNYGKGFGLIVTAISIVQSLTGIVLAFLFGLAVRRRFQIS